MAFSIEARPPLLDHRIVEWGLSRPVCDKFDAAPKEPLRQIVKDRGLGFLLDEPKRGFSLKTAEGPDAAGVLSAIARQFEKLGLDSNWKKVTKRAEERQIELDTLHFLSLWHQAQEH